MKRLHRRVFAITTVLAILCMIGAISASRASGASPQVRIDDPFTLSAIDRVIDAESRFPPLLLSDRDCYLVVHQGSAYVDIRLLGRANIPSRRMASALSASVSGTPFAGAPISRSESDFYSSAQIFRSSARLGEMDSSTTVPIGKIIARIASAGFRPHAVLVVPLYAMSSPAKTGIATTRNRISDISLLRPAASETVRVQIVPGGARMLLHALLPQILIAVLGIVLSIALLYIKAIPLGKRRLIFDEVLIGTCVMLMPSLYFGQGQKLADIWFGEFGSQNVALRMTELTMVTMGVGMAVMMPLGGLVKRKVLGEAPSFLDGLSSLPASKRREIARKVGKTALFGLTGLLLVTIGPFLLPVDSVGNLTWAAAGAALLALGFPSSERKPRQTSGGFSYASVKWTDEEIHREAQEMVARYRSELSSTPRPSEYAAEFETIRAELGAEAASLTNADLEYRFARVLVSRQRKGGRAFLPTFAMAAILLAAPYLLCVAGVPLATLGIPWSLFISLRGLVAIAALMVTLSVEMIGGMHKDDLAALRITRNLQAAEAWADGIQTEAAKSLERHATGLTMEAILNASLSSERKKRRDALRRAAKKLGIPASQ